jgi:hypothetical protein
MGRLLGALLASLTLLAAPMALARGGHSSHGGYHSGHSGGDHTYHHSFPYGSGHHSTPALGVPRDSHGHIKRSAEAKAQFKKTHPCPATGKASGGCPGYVIDHIQPLKRGGADAPSNMQWQTVQAAKLKDKTE